MEDQYHLDMFGQPLYAGDYIVAAYNSELRPFIVRKITDKMVSIGTFDHKCKQYKAHVYPYQCCKVEKELITVYAIGKNK